MRKITGILICGVLITTLFPPVVGENLHNVEIKSMSNSSPSYSVLSHVFAQGNGTRTMVGGRFLFGFGISSFMIVHLQEDGYVKITPLSNNSEATVLEGSHYFYILGFLGFQSVRNGIFITGLAIFTLWH